MICWPMRHSAPLATKQANDQATNAVTKLLCAVAVLLSLQANAIPNILQAPNPCVF